MMAKTFKKRFPIGKKAVRAEKTASVQKSGNKPDGSSEFEREEFLATQYSVLSDRRISHNELFWEVPLMFFTAQAFLYVIAFGSDISWWARAIASFISSLFGFLSIQVFERDRIMENMDAEQMHDIETYFRLKGNLASIIHHKPQKRTHLNGENVWSRLDRQDRLKILDRVRSSEIWILGLWVTTIISATLFILLVLEQISFFADLRSKLVVSLNADTRMCLIFVLTYSFLVFIYTFIEKEQPESFRRESFGVVLILHCLANIVLIIPIIVNNGKPTMAVAAFALLNAPLCITKGIARCRKKENLMKDEFSKSDVINLVLAGGASSRLVEKGFLNKGESKCTNVYINNICLLEDTVTRNLRFANKCIIMKGSKLNRKLDSVCENLKTSIGEKRIKISDDDSSGTAYAIFSGLEGIESECDDEIVVITPSDHVILDKESYHDSIASLVNLARSYDKLFLIGIYPRYAAHYYGYLKLDDGNGRVSEVVSFIEKPSRQKAAELILDKSIFWNSGVFVVKRKVLYKLYEDYTSFTVNNNPSDKSFSFDELIVTKAAEAGKVEAIKSYFGWADVGNPDVLKEKLLDGICSIKHDDDEV